MRRLFLLGCLAFSVSTYFVVAYWTRGLGGVYASLIGGMVGAAVGLWLRWCKRCRDDFAKPSFGDLKHGYGLAPLRVRGLAKVQLHADLTMLARLTQALSRTRAVAVAA